MTTEQANIVIGDQRAAATTGSATCWRVCGRRSTHLEADLLHVEVDDEHEQRGKRGREQAAQVGVHGILNMSMAESTHVGEDQSGQHEQREERHGEGGDQRV